MSQPNYEYMHGVRVRVNDIEVRYEDQKRVPKETETLVRDKSIR